MPSYPYPTWRRIIFASLLVVVLIVSFASSVTQGTVVVRVAGFIPGGPVTHVFVKFTEIRFHSAGYPSATGWISLTNLLPQVDLVPESSSPVPDALISARVQSGRYDAIALVAANSTIIVDSIPPVVVSQGSTVNANVTIPVPPSGFGDLLIVVLVDYNSIFSTNPVLSLKILRTTAA